MEDRDLEFLFDSPEVVSLCLNCSKRECDNCLGTNPSVKKPPRTKIDHDKFMRLYEAGLSDGEIAKHFGVNVSSIRGHRRKYDIPTKRPKDRFDKVKFLELYAQGLTDGEIAEALDLTTGYICSCRKKLGLPTKHPTKRRKINAEGIH